MKVAEAFGIVTKEDFIEAARALSMARHKDARLGTGYLLKAMVRGWDNLEDVIDHPDFGYLKEVSPANWQDFLKSAQEMALDR